MRIDLSDSRTGQTITLCSRGPPPPPLATAAPGTGGSRVRPRTGHGTPTSNRTSDPPQVHCYPREHRAHYGIAPLHPGNPGSEQFVHGPHRETRGSRHAAEDQVRDEVRFRELLHGRNRPHHAGPGSRLSEFPHGLFRRPGSVAPEKALRSPGKTVRRRGAVQVGRSWRATMAIRSTNPRETGRHAPAVHSSPVPVPPVRALPAMCAGPREPGGDALPRRRSLTHGGPGSSAPAPMVPMVPGGGGSVIRRLRTRTRTCGPRRP